MAKLEAFLALEETLAVLLSETWEPLADALMKRLGKMLEKGDHDKARDVVRDFTVGAAFEKLRPRLEELGVSSLLFGAGQLVPVRKSVFMQGGGLPDVLTTAIDQTVAMSSDALLDAVRREAYALIDWHDTGGRTVAVAKAVSLADPELAARMNAAVLGTGKGLVNIAANLSTSRLVSFGFLAQAVEMKIATYQVSEVLDRRTCPVCQYMHGKTFRVADGHSQVLKALSTSDIAELKSIAPWPKQDKASLADLYSMGPDELTARGWHTPPFHPLCYAEGTKVYTQRGFVDFQDVDIATDRFLSLNPENGQLEYVRAVKKIAYDYTGPMRLFDNGWGKPAYLVTPDHEVFYQRRVDRGKAGRKFEFRFGTQTEFSGSPEVYLYRSSEHQAPRQEVFSFGHRRLPMDAVLKVLGYYLSEGCVHPRDGWPVIAQEKHRDEMADAIRKAGWAADYWGDDKIVIRSKVLGTWLKTFGHAHEKFVPAFIKELPPEQIRVFLDAYALGDGCRRQREAFGSIAESLTFVTSSVRMRDDLVELLLRAGYGASFALMSPAGTVSHHKNGSYASNYDCWVVSRLTSRRRRATISEHMYSGAVYDVALERNHTLLVSFNGSVVWGSNCRGVLVAAGSITETVGTLPKTPTQIPVLTTGNPVAEPLQLTVPAVPLTDEVAALNAATEVSDGVEAVFGDDLTPDQLLAVQKLIDNPKLVNDYARFCVGPTLIKKADVSGFCSVFDHTAMGKLLDLASAAVKVQTTVKDATVLKKAVGPFQAELLKHWDDLPGAVIYDKGFVTTWKNDVPEAELLAGIKVSIVVPAGTKVISYKNTVLFDAGTPLRVLKAVTNKDGSHSLTLEILDKDAVFAPEFSDQVKIPPVGTLKTQTVSAQQAALDAAEQAASLELATLTAAEADGSFLQQALAAVSKEPGYKKLTAVEAMDQIKAKAVELEAVAKALEEQALVELAGYETGKSWPEKHALYQIKATQLDVGKTGQQVLAKVKQQAAELKYAQGLAKQLGIGMDAADAQLKAIAKAPKASIQAQALQELTDEGLLLGVTKPVKLVLLDKRIQDKHTAASLTPPPSLIGMAPTKAPDAAPAVLKLGKPIDQMTDAEAGKHFLDISDGMYGDAAAKLADELWKVGYKGGVKEVLKALEAALVGEAKPVVQAVQEHVEAKASGSTVLKYADFEKIGSKPGGSVPGALYRHKITGDEYIIKYTADDIGRNEVLAAKLYEAAGVKVPELELVEKGDGGAFVASKMLKGFAEDGKLLASGTRTPGLYDAFAVDAWLANWDTVGLSYDNIGFVNGQAVRIDVGGSLRYRAQGGLKGNAFGKSVGEIDSLRDAGMNPTSAKVFGSITQDELEAGVRRVLGVPDDVIRELVRVYGPKDKAEQDALIGLLLARKADLATRFPNAAKAPVQSTADLDPGVRVSEAEVRAVRNARLNGRVRVTDKDQIEDHHVLLHVEADAKSQPLTVAVFKVRGSGYEALKKAVNTVSSASAGSLDTSDLDNKVIAALKGIKYRFSQGQPAEQKDFDRVKEVRAAFAALKEQLQAARDDGRIAFEAYDETLDAYREVIEEMRYALTKVGEPIAWTWKGLFSPVGSVPFKPVEVSADTGWAFKKVALKFDRKEIVNGNAKRVSEDGYAPLGRRMYEHRENGVRIRWYADDAPAALKGKVEITVEGGDRNAAERVFQLMEKLGLNADRPSPLDREELYLRRLLYARLADADEPEQEWRDVQALLDKREQPERIRYLQDHIRRLTGIDIAAHPAYRRNVEGLHQAFDQGRVTHYRLDLLADPGWEEFERDYRLTHDLYNGIENDLERILNSGGSMAPTTDKLRRGIVLSGMSPESDLRTGGADYVFTRIAKASNVNTRGRRLVFKARLAARLDAISYGSDLYGQADSEAFVLQNRHSTLAALKSLHVRASNETILKNSVSLFDDLDYMLVDNQTQRNTVIDLLKRHKITVWPDGRSLEDVVRVHK